MALRVNLGFSTEVITFQSPKLAMTQRHLSSQMILVCVVLSIQTCREQVSLVRVSVAHFVLVHSAV